MARLPERWSTTAAELLLLILVGCSGAGDGEPSASSGGTNGAGASTSKGTGGGGSGGVTPGGSGASTNGHGAEAPVDPKTITCRTEGDNVTTLVFINQCAGEMMVLGSGIEARTVEPGGHTCYDVATEDQELPTQRYWGYIGEDPGAGRYTLAEFTFNTDFHDFDWYNISHVDAHNLPMQIIPVNRQDCTRPVCGDLLTDCPEVGRYTDSAGNLISCVSPNRDDSMNPVALHFESCDDGYAWSLDEHEGDDPSPMRACAGEDWDIVFCPDI